ncbi:hypothetical protein HDU81_009350 [Chytriomyces hyalinus]|nr:hypothetical protein HDU81_009350 [Chytriomyces hyalinus]
MRLLGLSALLAAATCAFAQTIANPANGTLADDLGVPQSVPETESLLPIPGAAVKDAVGEPATGVTKGLLGRLGDGLASGIKKAENAVSNSVAVLSGGNKEPIEAVEPQVPVTEDAGQVLTKSENSPAPQPDAQKPDGTVSSSAPANTEEQPAPVAQQQPSVQTENKVSDGKTLPQSEPMPAGQNKVSLPADAPLPEVSAIIPAEPSPQAKAQPDIPKQVPQDQAGSQTQKSPPQDQKEIQKPSTDSSVPSTVTKTEVATIQPTQASQTIQKQDSVSNSATIASTNSQGGTAKTATSVPSMPSSSSKNPAAQAAQGAEPNSANLSSQRAAQNPQSGGFPVIGIVVIVMVVIVGAVIIFLWQRNIRMATRSRLKGDGFAKMPEFLEDDKQRIDDIESVIGSRRGA